MIFQQILNEEAGCLSYLIGCGQCGEAAIVDPARDRVDEYVAHGPAQGPHHHPRGRDPHPRRPRLGQPGAGRPTGARIHLHPAADAAFATTPIEDGAEIRLGNVSLPRDPHARPHPGQRLPPGHRPAAGTEPWFVLTGDTLFVGDVGRPDFGGEQAAARLYQSLTTRLLTLPDSVEVYPAHGAGSSCGRAMSSKTAIDDRLRAALQRGAPGRATRRPSSAPS